MELQNDLHIAFDMRFYKGEDIHMTIGAFKDEALTEPGNFEGYGIDVLLYTSDDEYRIALSSEATEESPEWLPLKTNEDGTLDATITKGQTEDLDPGIVRIEIRLTSRATGKSFIASKSAFLLIESQIAAIAPCMPK